MTEGQQIGRAARTVLLSLALGTAAAVAFALAAAPLGPPLAAAGGAFGSTDLAHSSAALALLMVLQAAAVAATCALAALAVDLSPLAGAAAGVVASVLPAAVSAAAEGVDVLWPAPLVVVRVAGGFLAAGAGALACGLTRGALRAREGRQTALRRLREDSGLRLDREGQFWHRGGRIEHGRTQLVLHRGLHRAADGRWATRIGREWGYVEVEDAARFVRRIEEDRERPGRLRAQLWGGEWVEIDPASVAAGEGDVLYVRVPPGNERARLTRAAQLSLADRLREEGGAFSLELSGRRVAIGSDAGPENP